MFKLRQDQNRIRICIQILDYSFQLRICNFKSPIFHALEYIILIKSLKTYVSNKVIFKYSACLISLKVVEFLQMFIIIAPPQ